MIGEVSCEGSVTAAATPTVEIENRRRTYVRASVRPYNARQNALTTQVEPLT